MSDLSFYADMIRHSVIETMGQWTRPSIMYRPTLSADGTAWCALYGDDLQVGVAGFGDTPEEAMRAFDVAWYRERTPEAVRRARVADGLEAGKP